jgi:hypothetical protein
MREQRLSIPRVGSSNLSERAIGNQPNTVVFIGLSGDFASRGNHPVCVNGSGSKRTLTRASGRKVPEKIPDRFGGEQRSYQPQNQDHLFTDRSSVAARLGPYIYFWNRQDRKGQRCWMTARGTMNSCRLEFEDGFKMITSRNAIRREK